MGWWFEGAGCGLCEAALDGLRGKAARFLDALTAD